MPADFALSYVQIMLAAREESRRLQQSYVGVEHLFMALCRLGGVTENLLCRHDLDPRAVRGLVRQAVAHTFNTHYQPGMHFTPRLRAILEGICPQAAEEMSADISEHELLAAIIHEGNSVPLRVLSDRGIDLRLLLAGGEPSMGQTKPQLPAEAADGWKPSAGYSYLLRFGRDLTELARAGRLNPVIGRDEAVRHLEQTLVRATKSNPVLLGEAGVGKTAVVEALAQRIASGQVTPALRGKHLIEITLAQVTAGTQYRGSFEENLTKIIDAASKDPNIILVIDELHTIVGAGSAHGSSLDAANILKPALARGDIRVIGATTRDEYRRYIEPDAALERRFQPVSLDEPGPSETLAILSGIQGRFAEHHHVGIDPSAVQAAVELSARFLPDRHQPDKAIDLLDEACAYARVKAPLPGRDPAQAIRVTDEEVATVLTEWTGLPVADLSCEQRQRMVNMPAALSERVIGQDAAVQVVARAMETALCGLRRHGRPIAVLLFVGPTGVGKTELAKALAEFLFGSEKELIRLDMSEYQQRHEVGKLIGAPPGYIGHEESGLLTEALRNKPYSVVLLDEIEKAHSDVFDAFLQLFDEGRLTDAHGRTADGSGAIFIMTSNLGSQLYDSSHAMGFTTDATAQVSRDGIVRECRNFFRPEFFNRIDDVVVFQPLDRPTLARIVVKLLDELRVDLADKQIAIRWSDALVAHLAEAGHEPMYGARPLRRSFERLLVQPLAHRIVAGEFTAGDRLAIDVDGQGIVIAREGGA